MTNDTRAAAEQLHKQLGLRSAMCHCAEIDFTDWPTDLRAACDYCRTVDVIERAIQQARAPLRWTRETPGRRRRSRGITGSGIRQSGIVSHAVPLKLCSCACTRVGSR